MGLIVAHDEDCSVPSGICFGTMVTTQGTYSRRTGYCWIAFMIIWLPFNYLFYYFINIQN